MRRRGVLGNRVVAACSCVPPVAVYHTPLVGPPSTVPPPSTQMRSWNQTDVRQSRGDQVLPL